MSSRRRRGIVLGGAAVVVVAGVLGGKALADSSSQVASFRTAVVKRATVSQTEQRSGIIEPVAQGTVAFPISGNVTSVAVQPGQAVTAGQTLASLDTSSLQAELTAQQAQLAAAQLTLNNALNGQSTSPGGGSSSSGGGSSASNATHTVTTASQAQTGSRSTGSSGGSSSASSASLTSARQDVASAQQRVDGAQATAKTALGDAGTSCGTSKGGGSSHSTSTTSSSTSSTSTTSTTMPPQSGASQQCIDDLQASLNAQQQVASAQSGLAQAESKLAGLLASASPSGGSSQQQSTARSAAPASTPSLSGPTSAELVADQAAVDAAQANVTAAQQDLAQGTIVSPIDGTVAAVNMKAGDHVGAASSTENVVVVGPGGYEVTTTVPVTDIGNVKPGQDAAVVPDGAGSSIDGKVVSISVVPTTSGTNTVYPVVIGLNGSPDGLYNGGDAAVTITLNQAPNVLAVPTSAVRSAGGGAFHIVTVVSGGKTSVTPVQVGAVGPDLTEIKSGLQEGQQVMVADLNMPLPTNTLTRGFGGGGLGGGGGFGGATIGRGG
ncbi:MAG: HlyD family efflux transporter periplasmic adaptor subunit [Acidimicrobiia bacterium]|nr:HlyD family efflux transporter periplasmic adaptor subunit [Acidimicrobiia bacterium]